jgi:hypothetical protein
MADPVTNLNQTLANHPALANNPAIAGDVATSSNPDASATTLLHANNVSALQQALNDNQATHNNQSIWQSAFGGAAKAVGSALTWLNKPLQEVQRDYKFIHSVYTRHGVVQGLLATAGIAGGASLGAFFGPEGAAAGADLAGAIERNLVGRFGVAYRDSLNDSNNPNYKVSAGRDFANALAQVPGLGDLRNTDTGLGKVVSGIGDAAFDVNLDPLAVGLKAKSGIAQGKYLTVKTEEGVNVITNKLAFKQGIPALQNFLERNSLQTFGSSEQLNNLYNAGKNPAVIDRIFGGAGTRYVRSLDNIAKDMNGVNGSATVAIKNPGLQEMVPYLEDAKAKVGTMTSDDVHKVFLQTMGDAEFSQNYLSTTASFVPSRTVVRAALSTAADKLRQWDTNDVNYLRANQANFFVPRKGFTASIGPVTNPDTGEITQGIIQSAEQQKILPVVFRPFDKDAWKSALAGKVRTFSGYLPYAIDDKTLELSNIKFSPDNPTALVPIYRMARFSMSDQLAKQRVTEFANAADIQQKKKIYAGIVNEMLKAAGIPDSTEFVKEMHDRIGQMVEGPIDKNQFGHGYFSGDKVSEGSSSAGTYQRGLYEDHAGQFVLPDFREVKSAMRNVGTYGKIYGKIDNFAAKAYTDSVFKPLALLTAGFGLRIAASELLPAVFRFGVLETAKSKIATAAEKMNYKLVAGESDAILENATHAVSQGTDPAKFLADAADAVSGKRIQKLYAKGLTKLASDNDLDLAARIAIATRGHMGTGATLTGYGIPTEQQEMYRKLSEVVSQQAERNGGLTGKQLQKELRSVYGVTKNPLVPVGKYSFYTNVDPEFDLHYYTELSKTTSGTSRSQIASDLRDQLTQGKSVQEALDAVRTQEAARIRDVNYAPYARERRLMAGYSENADDFAFDRVDNILNLFVGREGDKVNMAFLDKVANGEKPTLDEIRALQPGERPRAVAGQRYREMPGTNLQQRITNFGFHHVIDPIINGMSREPLFFNHVKNEMRSLQMAVNTGKLSEEEALRIAMTRGSFSMVPQIHNTSLRTQFSVLARNYLPFYFAQEQAMRRAGNLILTNPQAFRQYQLVQQGINNPGFVEVDSNGQKHITLPVVGELGGMFLNAANQLGLPVVGNLPITVTGDLQSLKTVLPEFNTPGISPFVSIAANTLGAFDPTLDREIKKVTGGAGFAKGYFDQLMPNSVARTVYHAIDAKETETSFYNAITSAITSAAAHGQVPAADASPVEKQAFLDRIKNNAKSIMIMKAILGAVSPLAPAVTNEDPGLRQEFYTLLKQTSPVTNKPMTYSEALDKFVAEHGTGAISYTISKSIGSVPGATMPYTDAAINWIEKNQALLSSTNAVGAAFLVPQVTSGAGDAQAIHDEIIKMHLRANKTPADFLKSYYTAAGNNFISAQRAGHDKAMADLAGAGASQTQERAAWSAFVNQYGQMNPIWWDDYTSTAKKHVASQAAQDFVQMFAGKSDADISKAYGSQALPVKQLMDAWTQHNQAVIQLRASGATEYTKAENESWQTFLKKVGNDQPQLNTVINSVFSRLG